MSQPESLKFAESHEWITTGDEIATVGISHHAQEELSDIVFVELPEVGRAVAKGESIAVVESVKAASDIYAPAGGEIVEVNTALEDDPAKVNSDALGRRLAVQDQAGRRRTNWIPYSAPRPTPRRSPSQSC